MHMTSIASTENIWADWKMVILMTLKVVLSGKHRLSLPFHWLPILMACPRVGSHCAHDVSMCFNSSHRDFSATHYHGYVLYIGL